MLLDFIKGIALLLSLCLLQGFNVHLFGRNKRLEQIISGLLFGSICVFGMMAPVTLAPGVIFDARSVILSMAGLFGGTVVAMIAGTIAGIYRLWLGGAGSTVGITTIVGAVIFGLAYRHANKRDLVKIEYFQLLLFGVLLHLAILAIFTAFPLPILHAFMERIAAPYILTFSVGTMLLGLMMQDIIQRTRTEQALHDSEAKMRAIIYAIPDILIVLDEDGRYQEIISSPDHPLHRSSARQLGKTLFDVLPKETAERVLSAINKSITQQQTVSVEYEKQTPLGPRLMEGRVQPLSYTIKGKRVVIFLARDITERKIKEDEIAFLAFYDPLCGLPNRRLLQDRLHLAIAYSKRNHQYGALLFIDLDNFKTLNDTLGHDKGDTLLQQVALRLTKCVREVDTVARLGGDEFVVMLEQLSTEPEQAATQSQIIGEKILNALTKPYLISGHHYTNSASIGIALFYASQESSDELMKRADIAMYQAKAAGRNTLRFFDDKMQSAVSARGKMEHDLREALQQNQFRLHYQPQVDQNGHIIGAEALIRWQHPERGMVSPAEFIPLAEECGFIRELGQWVLTEACKQIRLLNDHADISPITISVNISAHQIHQPDFTAQVITAISDAGIAPQHLKLELTESLLLNDTEEIISKMTELKAKGVGFSLDDFGTGYSSLSYLKRLPLDQLKIDQSFVRDLLTDPNDAVIAGMIVTLAQSMGLNVIAEGVETEAQRDKLADISCYTYQGYLFGRPAPGDELLSRLVSAKNSLE